MLSCFSRVQFFATPWIVAHQVPLSMGFFRQEYWSGLLCPPPGDLPDPGVKPTSLMSPALAGGFFTASINHLPWKTSRMLIFIVESASQHTILQHPSSGFPSQNKSLKSSQWQDVCLLQRPQQPSWLHLLHSSLHSVLISCSLNTLSILNTPEPLHLLSDFLRYTSPDAFCLPLISLVSLFKYLLIRNSFLTALYKAASPLPALCSLFPLLCFSFPPKHLCYMFFLTVCLFLVFPLIFSKGLEKCLAQKICSSNIMDVWIIIHFIFHGNVATFT